MLIASGVYRLSILTFSFFSGDFAILLKSGLTFKQALAYNMASAVTAYIGLVIGIAIGEIESTHTWILLLTAGMFLYISLVDMVSDAISRTDMYNLRVCLRKLALKAQKSSFETCL